MSDLLRPSDERPRSDAASAGNLARDHVEVALADDPRGFTGVPRVRLLWGQHLLDDIVAGRYRTVVCAINDVDNSQGLIGQIIGLVPGSQWTVASATSYARVFRDAVSLHAKEDREPFVLKFDLDRVLVLALLRPAGRAYFELADIYRGFRTISSMVDGRRDRLPIASVSFLGAKANRVLDEHGVEPSLDAMVKAMHTAGFEGDLYPPPTMRAGAVRPVYPPA